MISPTSPVRFAGSAGQFVGFTVWSAMQTSPVAVALAGSTTLENPRNAETRSRTVRGTVLNFDCNLPDEMLDNLIELAPTNHPLPLVLYW
jgi:hypothetical protein